MHSARLSLDIEILTSMASEINKLKAVFEANNGALPKPPSKPPPQLPKSGKPAKLSPPHKKIPGGSPDLKLSVAGGSSQSLKGKPSTPPKKPPGKTDSLPSKSKASSGSPSTSIAASQLASVLKTSPTNAKKANSVELGGSGKRRVSETRRNGVANSPKTVDPPFKAPLKPVKGSRSASMSGSPNRTEVPSSPPPMNERANGSHSSRDVTSVFGVKLNHREDEKSASPLVKASNSSAKVKPLQPPPLRGNKLRSTSSAVNSGGNSTDDSAEASSRGERATSVPRDIELSGSVDLSAPRRSAHTPPAKRHSTVDTLQTTNISKASSTSDLTKIDPNGRKNKPLPPPKKPGLMGNKPPPPPKPSFTNTSPSKPLPKPPGISSLKNNPEFSRPRRGSTPPSRGSTPGLDVPTVDDEQKPRSRSFIPSGSGESQVEGGSLDETLKAPVQPPSSRGHSDSTSSWVVLDESSYGVQGEGKSLSSKGGENPSVKKVRTPPLPPAPYRVKSPETSSTHSSEDAPKSPSVNALRSKFSGWSSSSSSPPPSPASPLGRTGTPPKSAGENRYSAGIEAPRDKFSSPTSPTIVVKEADTSKRDSPLSGSTAKGGVLRVQSEDGVRSNVDSGFISEVPDDLTTMGQATSSENVSEEKDAPPTPLSPESQPEEQVVEEVWDEARVSGITCT